MRPRSPSATSCVLGVERETCQSKATISVAEDSARNNKNNENKKRTTVSTRFRRLSTCTSAIVSPANSHRKREISGRSREQHTDELHPDLHDIQRHGDPASTRARGGRSSRRRRLGLRRGGWRWCRRAAAPATRRDGRRLAGLLGGEPRREGLDSSTGARGSAASFRGGDVEGGRRERGMADWILCLRVLTSEVELSKSHPLKPR